jgi:RimJ/RimL family protein N-acetyltransferase
VDDDRVGNILETERLLLRELTADDADNLLELDGDPEVMRYLTGGKESSREYVETVIIPRILQTYLRFPGFGWYAAIEKATGAFQGWFGLWPPETGPVDLTQAEVGYRLRREAWGRGLATEGTRAVLARAFGELGVRRVWAETMAVNTRSRRVMEKCGLTYLRTFFPHFDDPIPGTEHGEVEYELLKENWSGSGTGDAG